MATGYKGQNLDQMGKSSAMANNDFIMFRDISEPDKANAYKTIRFDLFKAQIEADPGNSSTSWQSSCVAKVGTGTTFELPSTPIAATLQIYVGNVPQFSPANYTLSGSTVTFTFTVNAGTMICYSYAESLGPSSAVQDLQDVSEQGATTDRELEMPSLKFNAANATIKDASDKVLINMNGGVFQLFNANTVKVMETNSTGVSIPENLTVAKTFTLPGYKSAQAGEKKYIYFDHTGKAIAEDPRNLQNVIDVSPNTTKDIIFNSSGLVTGMVGKDTEDTVYLLNDEGKGIKIENGPADIRFYVGSGEVPVQRAYIHNTDGLHALDQFWVLASSPNGLMNLKIGASTNDLISRLTTNTNGRALSIKTQNAGAESLLIQANGIVRFPVRNIGTPVAPAYFTAAGDLIIGTNPEIPTIPEIQGTAGRILKYNDAAEGNADNSILLQDSTSIISMNSAATGTSFSYMDFKNSNGTYFRMRFHQNGGEHYFTLTDGAGQAFFQCGADVAALFHNNVQKLRTNVDGVNILGNVSLGVDASEPAAPASGCILYFHGNNLKVVKGDGTRVTLT